MNMFLSIEKALLNSKDLSLAEIYQIRKAKKLYLLGHNECAMCGCITCLEVHHIKPVHIFKIFAMDHQNMVTLCDYGNKGCHYKFGHFNDFTNKYNENIRELCIYNRLISSNYGKYTEVLLNEFSKSYNLPPSEFIKRTKWLIDKDSAIRFKRYY